MDYEKFQSFGQMSVTPDVLILPSELRYFIKVQAAHLYCVRPALFVPTWVFLCITHLNDDLISNQSPKMKT